MLPKRRSMRARLYGLLAGCNTVAAENSTGTHVIIGTVVSTLTKRLFSLIRKEQKNIWPSASMVDV